MTDARRYIRLLLSDLKAELQQRGMWSEHYPSAEAMASSEPFAVDTLSLEQWLQFVFMARLEAILDADAPLPDSCEVAPYAEQCLQNQTDSAELIRIIGKIDIMVTRTE